MRLLDSFDETERMLRRDPMQDLAALRRSRNAWRTACVFGLLCALAVAFIGWRMMP